MKQTWKHQWVVVVMMFMTLAACMGADDLDQGYLKTFGRGVLLASGKGFPEVDVYKPDQFDFRNRTFFIPAEERTTLDFRAILPGGKKLGDYLEQVKKERGQNLAYRTSDFIVWRVYPAFDREGHDLVDAQHPWPAKPSDQPNWGACVSGCLSIFLWKITFIHASLTLFSTDLTGCIQEPRRPTLYKSS